MCRTLCRGDWQVGDPRFDLAWAAMVIDRSGRPDLGAGHALDV